MIGIQQGASPTRLLEMLSDRFGAFEAIANSSIKLARVASEEELAMDLLVAAASRVRRRFHAAASSAERAETRGTRIAAAERATRLRPHLWPSFPVPEAEAEAEALYAVPMSL